MKYAPQLFYRTVLGLCLLWTLNPAGAQPSPAATPAAVNNVKYASSLSRFTAQDEQITLRNASSEYVLFVPVSGRWQVRRASLHLEFTNSIALAARAQLIVSLNRRRIAQLPLKSTCPDGSADIQLPAELLTEGYYQIKFEVAQHYTQECEDPTSPELWTQIDSLASHIDMVVVLRVVVFCLLLLLCLFVRRLWCV